MLFTIIVWVLLIIVLTLVIVSYEQTTAAHLKRGRDNLTAETLPKFSMNLAFTVDPMTSSKQLISDSIISNVIGEGNEHDCNATSLHKCDITDARTLFGCRELMVKCQHFDVDTPYIDNTGNNDETGQQKPPIIIPRNDAPNEGYALAIRVLADSCNPYHGDLVLTSLNPTSKEYMMVCSCKNPGYIGNEHLLGNCTTLYVCNGHVDNINRPLNQIECACKATENSVRYDDGVPVCKEMTVLEANTRYPDDWSHIVPWTSNRRTVRSNFNNTIRDNLRTRELLDPCLSSADDMTVEIVSARRNPITNECNLVDSGYPLLIDIADSSKWRNRLPPRRKVPGTNDDEPPRKRRFVTAVLATGTYEQIRFSDRIDSIDRIYGLRVKDMPANSLITKEAPGQRVVLHPPDGISFGSDQAINIVSLRRQFVSPKCTAQWPSFRCSFSDHFTYYYLDLPSASGTRVPMGFWWNYETWEYAEYMVSRAIDKTLERDGYALRYDAFENMTNIRPYGFLFSTKAASDYDRELLLKDKTAGVNVGNGVLVFRLKSDYDKHVQVRT